MPDTPGGLPGPSCAACPAPPVAQWQRRPTDAELAALVAAEQDRRQRIAQRYPAEQQPQFGPLPTAEDTTIAVQACAGHTIHLEAAAQVHAPDCTAPQPGHVPACDCTPEPLPDPGPLRPPATTLPTGWAIPAPTS